MFEAEKKNSVEKVIIKMQDKEQTPWKDGKRWKLHWLASVRSRYTSSHNVTTSVIDNVSTDAGTLRDSKVGKWMLFSPYYEWKKVIS